MLLLLYYYCCHYYYYYCLYYYYYYYYSIIILIKSPLSETQKLHFTLYPLFVQLMHTQNYSKIVELLKSFKTTVIVPTRFGLHKPSSGSSQSVLRQSYNIDFSVYMWLMKCCGCACAATAPKTSLTTCIHWNQYCNFGEAQTVSSLMMVYVNRNMLEQVL